VESSEKIDNSDELATVLQNKLDADVAGDKVYLWEESSSRIIAVLKGSSVYGGVLPEHEQISRAHRSICAFSGIQDHKESPEETYKAAVDAGAVFYGGSSSGTFFINEGADEFIVCLRPDKRTCVVLVATDWD